MTFMPKIEKTLKVLQVHIPEPTASSQYAVGTRSKFESTIPNRIGMGNLTGVTFDTHTSTDDTIILPAGRYYIQSSIPVGEPAHSSNSSDDQAYVEWQNFSSSSLNGTYTAFGNKGRSNPGDKLNDAGDNAGVHSYSNGIVESSNSIYLQVQVITNYSYTSITSDATTSSVWSGDDKVIIWRAD